MVRAILAGRKTQTRRVMKRKFPHGELTGVVSLGGAEVDLRNTNTFVAGRKILYGTEWCPFGQVGTRLWVRETWAKTCISPDGQCDGEGCDYCSWDYRSDDPTAKYPGDWPDNTPAHQCPPRWKPSIFMPRAASRITLEIIDVRVEQLQAISFDDALAEGIEPLAANGHWYDYQALGFKSHCPIASYKTLWESINGAGAWESNPFVWAITFKQT